MKQTRDGMKWGPAGPPPLLVKIAPDLTDADMKGGWAGWVGWLRWVGGNLELC